MAQGLRPHLAVALHPRHRACLNVGTNTPGSRPETDSTARCSAPSLGGLSIPGPRYGPGKANRSRSPLLSWRGHAPRTREMPGGVR